MFFTRVFVHFQKVSFAFMSPILPIYDLNTQKDAEFHKEFESAVENAIALQKHIVFKEILLLLQIYLIFSCQTPHRKFRKVGSKTMFAQNLRNKESYTPHSLPLLNNFPLRIRTCAERPRSSRLK